tara:strand:- start:27 stop:743 length:717 start_codon:yes stop_codon:yes gene_type:complete
MSITRLQQARQMFRYGGDTMGGPNDKSNNNNNSNGNGRPETTRHNPHTDSGTSKTSTVTGNEMKSAERDFIQTLNTNNAIRAAQTETKFSPYDGGSMFAPTNQKGFNWKSALFNAGLFALNPALAAKYGKAKSLYNAAKFGSKLATDLGLTNTDVVESITSNFTENFGKGKKSTPKSTSTNNTNNGGKGDGDGEGIASLDNQASGYDEYILLLQKLQSGTISDSERNRFNVLKSKLGI